MSSILHSFDPNNKDRKETRSVSSGESHSEDSDRRSSSYRSSHSRSKEVVTYPVKDCPHPRAFLDRRNDLLAVYYTCEEGHMSAGLTIHPLIIQFSLILLGLLFVFFIKPTQFSQTK